jgi:hypothetical protein
MNDGLTCFFYALPLAFAIGFPYACAKLSYALDPENKNGWRAFLCTIGKIILVIGPLCVSIAALIEKEEIWNAVCFTIGGYVFLRSSKLWMPAPA